MDINYELYKVFFYVATTLSFSEASKQLFISQSAVSQSIKALEKKLDQTLFIRSTKRVQLTPEGEILLRHVEPAMNLIKRGESQLIDSEFKDVFIANRSFAELKDKALSLRDLLNYPILMLDRKSTTSEFLHSLFQKHQLDLVPEIELSSNDLLIDLAKIGLGIAFIPDYCVPKDSDDLFVVHTDEVLPTRQLVVVHNEHVPVSKATLEFLNYFQPIE